MQGIDISFAGAGKVAEALCMELFKMGHQIGQIVSPGAEEGENLASRCGAKWSDKLLFNEQTRVIIVAVPDMNLPEVLSSIRCGMNTVVAHTAGSFGLEVFPANINRKGVFYPLQTFSKGRKTDFSGIPVFIESAKEQDEILLQAIAESLDCKVYKSDTAHRRLLHAAAVFVSNFTNFMLTSGKEVSSKAGFPFEVLKPLIIETVSKALEAGPEKSQTGPAVRYDLNTIEKHLELLSFSPELKRVYGEMTRAIIEHYKLHSVDE